ncbi:unnamed protein product [Candida verbasci]|uniref:Protein DSE1 n=1 Tax=Candida verbasci TaxID=1227364 RepID=A0A9W4TVB2_9ASCO|nr:unnamed protein product [Candida verbasci]
MTEFYEPTLLFRANAIKKFNPSLSPISSCDSLSLNQETKNFSYLHNNNSSSSSWLLNSNNPNDTKVLYKSCSLNKTNVKSNYWKIPDSQLNLTSLAITQNNDSNIPKIAISSGYTENNLFIYELNLNNNHLIHHSTISLSSIYNMEWLNSKYLITGNNKGYAHLISIPIEDDDSIDLDDEPSAEIFKRFNHRKYLKKKTNTISQPIKKLKLTNNYQNLITIYNDSHLFNWDIKNSNTQLKPSPLTISTIPNIKNFDVNLNNPNYLSICGKFGVSLFDLRECKFNVPNQEPTSCTANIIKWNFNNENLLAVGNEDGVVRLWDLRKQDSILNLSGHLRNTQVTSLEWINNNDIISGGSDGNIIHWDLSSDGLNIDNINQTINCGLTQGLDSLSKSKYDQRQCGTILPASNTNIISMCSVENSIDDDIKVISIDGSSFLGVHSKIQEDINISLNTSKLYYTEEDLQLLLNSTSSKSISNATLLDSNSQDSIIQPLDITRKPTIIYNNNNNNINNVSNDTLVGEDLDLAKEEQITENSNELEHEMIEIKRNESLSSSHSNNEFEFISTNQLYISSCENSPNTSTMNESFDSISTIATDKDLIIMDDESKQKQNEEKKNHKRNESNEFIFNHIFDSLDDSNIY